MVKEAIGEGATVLEAQEAACKALGVESHEAEFEVLQMPEKKILGIFGGSPAKVRAYITITPANIAKEYLTGVLEAMGVTGIAIDVEEVEGGAVFNLTGDDVGFVIGRRGETLDALQYLTGLVANHVENSYYRITINTGNYREKREKTLEVLARKMAIRASKTGRTTTLEPMNPYERRIIHTTVQKVTGAISWSEGVDLGRHVVIGPDPECKPARSSRRDDRRPPYRKPGQGGSRPPRPAANRAAVPPAEPRAPKKEAPAASLYGKIEPKK